MRKNRTEGAFSPEGEEGKVDYCRFQSGENVKKGSTTSIIKREEIGYDGVSIRLRASRDGKKGGRCLLASCRRNCQEVGRSTF